MGDFGASKEFLALTPLLVLLYGLVCVGLPLGLFTLCCWIFWRTKPRPPRGGYTPPGVYLPDDAE